MTWSSSSENALLPFLALALSGAAAGGSGALAPPTLDVPVACDMADVCSVQKYVDRDPGAGRLDYRCGTLTTDGHGGTDFRLRRFPDLERDVAVLAAASGRVARTRDGMPDVAVTDSAVEPIGERLAGNAVVIDHGGGWETQYSHLKRGSVRVRPGDRVEAGTRLGAIGMSGNADYPHLHFDLRHNGQKVDPFAATVSTGCGITASGLWSASAQNALVYRATEILSVGFAATEAEALTAFRSLSPPKRVVDPPALILWGNVSGVQSGDLEKFRILAPNRGVLFARQSRIMRGRLHWVGFAGMKRPAGGWEPGIYVGIYQLVRDGQIMAEEVTRKYLP